MVTYKLAYNQTLGGGDETLYIAPTDVVASVRALTLHNPTSDNVAVIVMFAGVQIIKKTLSSNQSYLCPELANHLLPSGVTVVVSGQGVNAVLSVSEQVI